ncbi:MAG: ankyrin repeat domain-containing protein [Proteobacteria bacterium]|nr:ankyrin repeat domain-containing protein [Pseudomonadota bacterium]
MYFSAGTSAFVHIVVVAASLGTLPAIELAFGDRFGRGATRDILSYEESNAFKSKFSTGALTSNPGETIEDETASGVDPDDNVDTLTSGEFGFNEVGDSTQTDTRRGTSDAPRQVKKPADIAGKGEDQAKDDSLEGEREDEGDTGDAKEAGEATREIIIFVNLRPEPEPDQEVVEAEPAREAGPTETPAPIAIDTAGDALTQVAALNPDSLEIRPEDLRAGNPDSPAEGESTEGRESTIDPTRAVAPEVGEILPSSGTAAAKSDIEGGLPDSLPIADKTGLAPTRTTAAINRAKDTSGVAEASEETTAVQAATGQPGLPDAGPAVKPKDEPIRPDTTALPQRDIAVPLKGIPGALTPAPQIEDHQQLQEPEEAGASLARIGAKLPGVTKQEDGLIGQNQDTAQKQIKIAEGLPDAQKLTRRSEEVRDGAPESERERAEKSKDSDLAGTEIAAVQSGNTFVAPETNEFDRPALRNGDDDPLAKVIAAIAGDDDTLARALSDPSPFDTIGGVPDPGTQRTNEILKKAADAGLAKAQTKLAKRYVLGLVDGSDPKELVKLLRNAAERGDKEAQLMLGALFADGRIVPQDTTQSHVFFDMAAAQGSAEANEILPVLERQMAPQEIADSRRLAREYKRLLDAVAQTRVRGSNGAGLRDELLDAAAAGNTAKIAELLSRGADLEGDDASGRTAVINAAWRGRTEVVDLLVELGADFNVTDYEGRTAVSWAASNGHNEIVKKLVEAGARPNVIDHDGLTPLMRAAWNGHDTIVRLLIESGAQASMKDGNGKTALDYAIEGRHRDVARTLRSFGA